MSRSSNQEARAENFSGNSDLQGVMAEMDSIRTDGLRQIDPVVYQQQALVLLRQGAKIPGQRIEICCREVLFPELNHAHSGALQLLNNLQ